MQHQIVVIFVTEKSKFEIGKCYFQKVFQFCQVWRRSIHYWLFTGRCQDSSRGKGVSEGIINNSNYLNESSNHEYIEMSNNITFSFTLSDFWLSPFQAFCKTQESIIINLFVNFA